MFIVSYLPFGGKELVFMPFIAENAETAKKECEQRTGEVISWTEQVRSADGSFYEDKDVSTQEVSSVHRWKATVSNHSRIIIKPIEYIEG